MWIIGKKITARTNLVNLLSHFLMICAHLCSSAYKRLVNAHFPVQPPVYSSACCPAYLCHSPYLLYFPAPLPALFCLLLSVHPLPPFTRSFSLCFALHHDCTDPIFHPSVFCLLALQPPTSPAPQLFPPLKMDTVPPKNLLIFLATCFFLRSFLSASFSSFH